MSISVYQFAMLGNGEGYWLVTVCVVCKISPKVELILEFSGSVEQPWLSGSGTELSPSEPGFESS